ncbi:MAG: type II secretion system F family protein [Planctomycetes bacterium]|nr:type II secretion system F family protein [Planctomycetota bacterium]
MPTFAYEAMNSVGQPVKGEVEAGSNEEAIAKVRGMGNFPTKIKEKAGGKKSGASKPGQASKMVAGTKKSSRSVGSIPQKLLVLFTRNLSILVDAGLPILRSLRILEEQQKPGPMRIAVRLVADDVEGGTTLSDALGRHPKAFDKLFVNMVRAGELGGVLDVILKRLAEFMEKAAALKRKVIGAMIYPIAVLSFAGLIVVGIMVFVIPQFETIFADMGTRLPAMTRNLINMSTWMKDYGWAVIAGIPVFLIILAKFLRKFEGGRYALDKFKLSMPIFGQIIGKTAIARFTRTLGTLLAAGVPILEALGITSEAAGNEVYSRAMKRVQNSIREGVSFAEPLRQTKVVDSMVVNMIDVGEETGELDKMLTKIADTYDDEVSTLVASMVSLIEPIMVISLGGIVGFIVISLFMPMVALLQTAGGG